MTANRSLRLRRQICLRILGLTVPVLLVGVLAASPVLSGTATAAAVGRTAAAAPKPGPLLAWGLNEVGQLGTGDKSHYDSPVRVNAPYGLRAIGARSGNSSVAVNSSGHAYPGARVSSVSWATAPSTTISGRCRSGCREA